MKINQLKAGVILSYCSMAISNVISLVYTPIMLKMLGQSEYGLYTLCMSTVSYLGLMTFGFGSSYIRFYTMHRTKNDRASIAKLNGMFITIYSVIAIITLVVGSVLISNIEQVFGKSLSNHEIQSSRIILALMVASLVVNFLTTTFSAYVTSNERYVFQKIVNLVNTIINPLVMLPLLMAGYKTITMSVVTLLCSICHLVINIYYCKRKIGFEISFQWDGMKEFKSVFTFSFFIFINMVIDQINWAVDKFLLGIYKGTVMVAIYGVASQLNNYYLNFSSAISGVFAPMVNRFVNEENGDEKCTDLFVKVGRIQFLVLALIMTGFIFFGREFILLIWGGKEYEVAYYIALLLMIPVTVPLIQNIGIEIQRAKNKHQFRSLVYLVIAIINIIMSIPLCKHYGGIGCAIGTTISLVIGNIIIMNVYYQKELAIDIKRFWMEISHIAIGLIIPLMLGIGLELLCSINTRYELFMQITLYLSVYIICVWSMGMNEYEKELIMNLFRKMKRK